MKIVVDGLPLLGESSLAIYLRELLIHLADADGTHEYGLFFRAFRKSTRVQLARVMADPLYGRFTITRTCIPDRLLEWCWTLRSLHLPFTEARLGRPDIFLSTAHLTPVLRGTAIVTIAYGLPAFRFPQYYGQDQPFLSARLRRGVERAAAIIAISEFTKREYVEWLGADPKRIHVVYPGVDKRFSAGVDADATARVAARYGLRRPYILYVGVLAPHKNVETLVTVFRRLKQAHRIPHQLVLCGRAAWGNQAVASAEDLIRAGECRVLDFIPEHEVPPLYHGAEVFAFLSLHEGFGLPPLEAMACGVPVVSSNAGSLPEVIGDAGMLVPPTDEERIEAALLEVATRPDLRQDLIARGRRQAARFNWSDTARQTLKVFAEARGAR